MVAEHVLDMAGSRPVTRGTALVLVVRRHVDYLRVSSMVCMPAV
jgi:hypothetical protein